MNEMDDDIAELEVKLAARKRARKKRLASERMKRLNADPEFKARTSERMKRLNAADRKGES